MQAIGHARTTDLLARGDVDVTAGDYLAVDDARARRANCGFGAAMRDHVSMATNGT